MINLLYFVIGFFFGGSTYWLWLQFRPQKKRKSKAKDNGREHLT